MNIKPGSIYKKVVVYKYRKINYFLKTKNGSAPKRSRTGFYIAVSGGLFVAEGDAQRAGLVDDIAFGRNILELAGGFFQRDRGDLVVDQNDELAVVFVRDHLGGFGTETRGKHAVIRAG